MNGFSEGADGMGDLRQLLGRQGEARAIRWLKKKGYQILETNYRNRNGEIDIITLKGEIVVFVEVKTRSSLAFGQPAEAVSSRKQESIARVAQGYLLSRDWMEHALRFDVIEVLLQDGKWQVHQIEQAF